MDAQVRQRCGCWWSESVSRSHVWCRCAVLSAMFLSRESAILFYIKMGLIENMMGAPDYGMSEHICMLEHHIIGFVRKYSALNAYGLELFEASFCHLNCRLRCPAFWTPLFLVTNLDENAPDVHTYGHACQTPQGVYCTWSAAFWKGIFLDMRTSIYTYIYIEYLQIEQPANSWLTTRNFHPSSTLLWNSLCWFLCGTTRRGQLYFLLWIDFYLSSEICRLH